MELDYREAWQAMANRVCSDCWGNLVLTDDKDGHYGVKCITQGCTTPALISKKSMLYRMRMNEEQFWRVTQSYKKAIPWLAKDDPEKKSPEEIIQIIEMKGKENLMNKSLRQDLAFPEVALIKKGTPKQIVTKEGKSYKIQGKDLKQKFRIHFLPGTEDVKAAWDKFHAKEYVKYGDKFAIPDGYEVTSVVAVLPSQSVWDSWNYVNSTYDAAGRRIGEANDDHYLTLRDGATGAFIIKNGEPYKKFTPGDTIDYERNGKKYSLKMRTDGRLRLVLRDLVNSGCLVQCVLKTTSFYDCQNIKKQLAGIQVIADMVNGGNAGGIPIMIYRSETECVWNKPDGSAARVKQWFINIKADPEWVKHAFARLGQNALVGTQMETNLLPAPVIEGSVSPEAEVFDDGDALPGDEVVEGIANEPVQEVVQEVVQGEFKETHQQEGLFNYLSATIVNHVADIARISAPEAAKYIAQAMKDGRIKPGYITIDEAEEFAKHINV